MIFLFIFAKMNKIIAIFDFDATLFDTPLPTKENREILRLFKGYDKPGWWGRAESMDTDVFEINPNPWIKERYLFHKSKEHTLFLLTGRIQKLKDTVEKLTDTHGFDFDDKYFADGRKTIIFKEDIIRKLVKEHNPSEVYFYDDRTEHIPTFRKIGDNIEDELNIKFRLFHVIGWNGYELKYSKKLR